MTDFLRVNGIPISVADGSAAGAPEVIGRAARGLNGSLVAERRRVKRRWDFATPPLDPVEALAIEGLLLGRGWTFDFETGTGTYAANGGATIATGSRSAVQKKFGTYSWAMGASSVAKILFGSFDPAAAGQAWTVAFWWWNGTTWQHIIETSEAERFVNGVSQGALSAIFVSESATELDITNPDAATRYVDDLWVSPYLWPSTWPAAVYGYASATAAAPRLTADGLLIGNGGPAAAVLGDVSGSRQVQGYLGAVWTPNLTTLSASLAEV